MQGVVEEASAVEQLEAMPVSLQVCTCLKAIEKARNAQDWVAIEQAMSLLRVVGVWSAIDESENADEDARSKALATISILLE